MSNDLMITLNAEIAPGALNGSRGGAAGADAGADGASFGQVMMEASARETASAPVSGNRNRADRGAEEKPNSEQAASRPADEEKTKEETVSQEASCAEQQSESELPATGRWGADARIAATAESKMAGDGVAATLNDTPDRRQGLADVARLRADVADGARRQLGTSLGGRWTEAAAEGEKETSNAPATGENRSEPGGIAQSGRRAGRYQAATGLQGSQMRGSALSTAASGADTEPSSGRSVGEGQGAEPILKSASRPLGAVSSKAGATDAVVLQASEPVVAQAVAAEGSNRRIDARLQNAKKAAADTPAAASPDRPVLSTAATVTDGGTGSEKKDARRSVGRRAADDGKTGDAARREATGERYVPITPETAVTESEKEIPAAVRSLSAKADPTGTGGAAEVRAAAVKTVAPQDATVTGTEAVSQSGGQTSLASRVETIGRGFNEASAGVPQDVSRQVGERLGQMVRRGDNEMRIALRPETLGHLSLKISSEQHLVTVHVTAETQVAKELIETHLGQLRADLSQQGISLDAFDVDVATTGEEGGRRPQTGRPNVGPRLAASGAGDEVMDDIPAAAMMEGRGGHSLVGVYA
jgi:flagellar hook-length control protein FliK